MEAICRLDHPAARPWLLRKALDGDHLNGYFAGKVATTARLHEAIDDMDNDDEIVDHTGRLLHAMTYCEGMTTTLKHHEHAPTVLAAHARNVGRLQPTIERFLIIAQPADYLRRTSADDARLRWPADAVALQLGLRAFELPGHRARSVPSRPRDERRGE